MRSGVVCGWMGGCVWVMEGRKYSIGRGDWRRSIWRSDGDCEVALQAFVMFVQMIV